MKNVIMLLCSLLFLAGTGWNQSNRIDLTDSIDTNKTYPIISMSSESSYAAYSDPQKLTIHDATILNLNLKAMGLENNIRSSGIIGMPKVAYGIANGRLLLRNTTSPTSGIATGSGSVGTGTHLGNIGAGGNSIGVNGKSPDAGPALYGVRPYGNFLQRAKDWIIR